MWNYSGGGPGRSGSGSGPERRRLNVVTLNAWFLPLGVLSPDTEARVDALAAAVADPEDGDAGAADVLCLQEVWPRWAQRRIVDAARRAGYRTALASPTGGLLLLSRALRCDGWRFAAYANRGLPQRVTHADFYGGKGVLAARLSGPSSPGGGGGGDDDDAGAHDAVIVANTHLHASYTASEDEEDEYDGIRAAQVLELSSFLRGLRRALPGPPPPPPAAAAANVGDDKAPIIIAGDFNIHAGPSAASPTPEYTALVDALGAVDAAADAAAECEPDGTWYQTWNTPENAYADAAAGWPDGQRIDLVLACRGEAAAAAAARRPRGVAVRPAFAAAVPGAPALSDHLGVAASFVFPDNNNPWPQNDGGYAYRAGADGGLVEDDGGAGGLGRARAAAAVAWLRARVADGVARAEKRQKAEKRVAMGAAAGCGLACALLRAQHAAAAADAPRAGISAARLLRRSPGAWAKGVAAAGLAAVAGANLLLAGPCAREELRALNWAAALEQRTDGDDGS